MNRSRNNPERGLFVWVAVQSACLLVSACGNTNAAGTSKLSVADAGTVAKATPSGGKAGGALLGGASAATAGIGSRSMDASTSDRDRRDSAGADGLSDGGVREDAATSGSGTSGCSGVSGCAAISNNAAASGSGGVTRGAAVSGSGGIDGSGEAGRASAGGGGGNAVGSDTSVPGATVTLTGQVIEVHADGNFTSYGGAEVCVLDSMPPACATADSSGSLTIELPASSRTGLTMQLPGMFPMLTPIATGTSDINLSGRGEWSNYGASVVLSEETRNAAVAMLGTTLNADKGQADMIVFGLGSGVVTLEGAPAELKWFSSGGQFTVTDGTAPFGSVLHGFTNVEPGMRTFRAALNGEPCAFDPLIWPGDAPGTVSVPIRAGWWTRLMEVRCN